MLIGSFLIFGDYLKLTVEKKEQKSEPNEKELASDTKDIVILIAEDEETNYLYLEELFSEYDYKLLHAHNGLDAVNMCKENSDISLVLMDIKMPKMNGLEATKIIKEIRPDLPIIAQTAFAMDSDKQKAIAVGCDDYISKPIIQFNLLNTIKKYI